MEPAVIELIRRHQPSLLAWDDLSVSVLKDPRRPLSVVSQLGVPHGGLEKDSALYRIADGEQSFIVKRHLDAARFRCEVANFAFVGEAGGFAPAVVWTDDESGAIVMEDLGDHSLAWVWKSGDMAQYQRWVHEAVEVVLSVQAHFHRHEQRVRALYGDQSPESAPKLYPPEETLAQLDEILRVSRGAALPDRDRAALMDAVRPMNARLERFGREHRTFSLGLTPWHILRKEGRLRVIDLTFQPIGPVLGELGDLTWHLESRREIVGFYLDGRVRLGLPPLDRDEFLRLSDWLTVLGCLLWIRIYCRDILEGEQALVDLGGARLTDYAANEGANLAAIRRALAPYPDLSLVSGVLERAFRLPLRKT